MLGDEKSDNNKQKYINNQKDNTELKRTNRKKDKANTRKNSDKNGRVRPRGKRTAEMDDGKPPPTREETNSVATKKKIKIKSEFQCAIDIFHHTTII